MDPFNRYKEEESVFGLGLRGFGNTLQSIILAREFLKFHCAQDHPLILSQAFEGVFFFFVSARKESWIRLCSLPLSDT
jgi:hypothetical protein